MNSATLANRYRLTKELGDGTFGQVWLGTKLDGGERVAIKRLD